ncbi:MAG: TonB-dependent receptor [Pseudomonadota bacterium]
MFENRAWWGGPRWARLLDSLCVVLVSLMIGCHLAVPALADDVEQHPDVVVSASRVPLPAKEIGSAVTVITDKELEERQVRIVSDVLRDVPGVAVNRSGPVGTLTQVRIRGAEGNQTLVRIDGIEVNNPAAGSEFNFANLLNTDIERIEVLRGPQSALYGSDAIGGVIDIKTKDPEPGFTVSGRGEGGSFSTWDGLANFGYGSEQVNLSGSVQRFVTDGVSVADERDGNTESDGYKNTTARIKAGFKPFEILEFDAVGILVDSDLDNDASAPIVNVIDSGDTSESLQKYGLASAKLTLFEGTWEQIARASYINDDTDFFDEMGTKTFTSEGTRTTFDYQSNVFFLTPDVANASHTLTFAAERDEEEQFTDSPFSGPDTVSVVNYGYMGEYRVGLWDQLFLSGAVRYDDNDDLFENETTYRATAAYLHTDTGTRLHGSVGRAVKNPTLFQLFGFTPNFMGNPNLKPEQGFGWDAGVEQAFFDDRLIVDVTYYNNRIKDLIQGAGNTAVNLSGTSKIQGVEVSASAEPLPNLILDAAYTYTDGEDAEGVRLLRRPMHIASFVANYGFDVMDRPANLNLSIQYNGEQDDIVFDSFFPVETRKVTLDSYTLVGIAASYEVIDGVSLFARGENLLDEDYQDVFGFGTAGISGFAGVRINLGPFASD